MNDRPSNFERKYGKYAIPHLTTILIACYAVGYILYLIGNMSGLNIINYLTLNPYLILHGQVWRIVTWILVPSGSSSLFSVLIMMLLYWQLGSTLEKTWGTYRYNVYIFSGLLFTITGAFLSMGLAYLFCRSSWLLDSPTIASYIFQIGSSCYSTYYINMSIFLAFAVTFPDMRIMLMFIIPIKMKWMAVVYAVLIGFNLITAFTYYSVTLPEPVGTVNLAMFQIIAIVASLLNFLVYFLATKTRIVQHIRNPKMAASQREYKRQTRATSTGVTKHKCAICGRTEVSNPELQFRFCSKCTAGNYEYCSEHLYTHEHRT